MKLMRTFRKKIYTHSRTLMRSSGVFLLLLMTLFYSFGGVDVYLGLTTPFTPKSVDAAYTGKQLRTIEYILGDGSENTAQGTGVLSYAGASWNTVKATAGKKSVVIAGSGIRVVNAYLEVSFNIATAASLNRFDVYFDADYSPTSGADTRVNEIAANTPFITSGLTGYMRGTHDVTAFFATTSDVAWNAGVPVVGGVATTFSTTANRALSTMKLVITYEADVSASVHNEVKTVRLPLDSTNGTDTGTRQAVCAAGATCGFTYDTNNLPDIALDADILDVYFEIHAEVSSALISSFQPQIIGGTAGPVYSGVEVLTDDNTKNVTYRPNIGAPDFTRNTLQTLNIINSAGTAPLYVLGGEVVVTYRYSTGASAQSETVRYFVDQDTVSPGTVLNPFATITPIISNSGRAVKHIWYRVHSSPYTATTNFIVSSQVGTSTKVAKTYAISAANPRSGDTPTIIHDMSADAGNYFDNTIPIGGSSQSNKLAGPVAVELYVTFTWDGNTASDVTKSVTYSGAQQGVNAVVNGWNNRPVYVELPETVTKTYRSAYLFANYSHSNTTSITVGTVTLGVNASTTVVTKIGDAEAYNSRYLVSIASSTLSSGGDTIPWTTRALEINESTSVANTAYFGNEIVVTYDVALGGNGTTPSQKQLKTIEYILGGGSDTTARATAVTTWAGSTWGATKAGAGTQPIVIEGTNIRVVNAFIETAFTTSASGNVTNEDVVIDVAHSSSAGTDAHVGEVVGVSIHSTTGLLGYVHGNHDVTAFFDRQSDANWAAGVGVTAGIVATLSAGNRELTSMRLVITYETDFSLVPHYEVKTVRFPLDSTAGTDTGTMTATCGAGATCPFTYTANIPDATTDADILDVHFDMHAGVNSAVASSFTFQIVGMPAPSALFSWTEVLTNYNSVNVFYPPPVGVGGFERNLLQTVNIANGTVALNALGGEIVITYRFWTGAPEQTETVRYFLNQNALSAGLTRSDFVTIAPAIPNARMAMKNIWYKVHAAPWAAVTLTVYGTVGTSTEKSNVYTTGASSPRTGDTPTFIYDLSGDVGNFFASSTTIAGATKFSSATGASPTSAEAYFTFTWDGSYGGASIHTVLFSAAQQGVNFVANVQANRPLRIELPETVEKTYRSAYLETGLQTSRAASTILAEVLTLSESDTPITITTNGDTEAFHAMYFLQMASSSFSNGDTISWDKRVFEVGQSKSVANYTYFSNTAVVTYDTAQAHQFPSFAQNYFRIYVDNDALLPTDPWPVGVVDLGENTEMTMADTPIASGANLRLRMSLQVSTTTMLASSTDFDLQYAPRVSTCDAIGAWNNLGAIGSGSLWRGFNATPLDGTNLSIDPPTPGDTLLSVSSRAGTYGESIPTPANPFMTAVGENVEYDWNVQNNGAATDTPYCFRMVQSGGTPLYAYTYYPTIATEGYTAQSDTWHWYDDETAETPSVPLSGSLENSAPTDVLDQNIIKLRIALREVSGNNGTNQKFRLQYSEWADFTSGVHELDAKAECTVTSTWCYGEGVDTDDASLTALKLTTTSAFGRHNEAGTSTSTMSPLSLTPTEFEYTIKRSGGNPNTTYFFRLWDNNHNRPVLLSSGASYPSLSTEGTSFTATIAGIDSFVATEGVTTDATTTAMGIPFGVIPIGSTGVIAGQRLTVSTNSSQGYQVFLKGNQDMTSSQGSILPGVTSVNATPATWLTACASVASGCLGYHTGDDTLSSGSTRFLSNDTYASIATSSLDEIIFNSGPVTDEVTDIIYRIEAHQLQAAGEYTTQLQYVFVPIF